MALVLVAFEVVDRFWKGRAGAARADCRDGRFTYEQVVFGKIRTEKSRHTGFHAQVEGGLVTALLNAG